MHQRRCQIQTALHASGVAFNEAVGGIHEIETLEQKLAPFFYFRFRQVNETTLKAHELAPGKHFIECRILAGVTDETACAAGIGFHFRAANMNGAAIELLQSGHAAN